MVLVQLGIHAEPITRVTKVRVMAPETGASSLTGIRKLVRRWEIALVLVRTAMLDSGAFTLSGLLETSVWDSALQGVVGLERSGTWWTHAETTGR
jgi:hypothetical protein